MTNKRYEKGMEKLKEFISDDEGTNHNNITEALEDIAPDISKYMIEFTYGDIYTRPYLDNKQRAMVTIASLVAIGTLPQLELHINAGLTAGLTCNEIIEIFIHQLSYVGFPKVLNAVGVAKKVFKERGVNIE